MIDIWTTRLGPERALLTGAVSLSAYYPPLSSKGVRVSHRSVALAAVALAHFLPLLERPAVQAPHGDAQALDLSLSH